ncbi:hypothetical protein [Rickettsia endosymbiont of Urophora cardui]|uniref:hypothetical protein n=1 Tax=Rickettsia endosymbiont of Urophora cardui TaxID=3066265 RepID=UPI00313C7CAE
MSKLQEKAFDVITCISREYLRCHPVAALLRDSDVIPAKAGIQEKKHKYSKFLKMMLLAAELRGI